MDLNNLLKQVPILIASSPHELPMGDRDRQEMLGSSLHTYHFKVAPTLQAPREWLMSLFNRAGYWILKGQNMLELAQMNQMGFGAHVSVLVSLSGLAAPHPIWFTWTEHRGPSL